MVALVNWLDELFAGQASKQLKIYVEGVPITPVRGAVDLHGDATAEDNGSTLRTDVTIPTFTGSLSNDPPADVADTAAEGSSSKIERAGHVHAHGTQSTGTHHAPAIADGANGFFRGTDQRWLDAIRADFGTALTDADETVLLSAGSLRKIPTLTSTRNKTLSLTGAAAGDWMILLRTDTSTNPCAIIDGGVGTPTLFTFDGTLTPAFAVFQVNAARTHWELREGLSLNLNYLATSDHNGMMSDTDFAKLAAYPLFATLSTSLAAMTARLNRLAPGRIKWLLLGNSKVAGQSIAAGQTWPTRFVARVRGGSGYHVNAGFPGDKLSDMLARYATDITAKLSATDPNVLVVAEYATNDVNNARTSTQCYDDLKAILDLARDEPLIKAIIVIDTPPATVITGSEETERVALIAKATDPTTGVVARYSPYKPTFYIDVREIPEFADTIGTSDGVHETAASNYAEGNEFAVLVNNWIEYVEPSPKTRTHCHEPGDFCAGEWDPANKTLSTSDVTQIDDISGRTKHLVWAGSLGGNGMRPLWVANSGKPYVTFDATNNEALVYNGNIIPSKGPFHLFMYVRPLATTSGRIWAQSNAGASHFIAVSADAATPINVKWENLYDSGSPSSWDVGDPDNPSVRAAATMTAGAAHMIELIHDGYRMRQIVDETECANMVPNPATITTIGFCFGGIWLGAGGNVFVPKSFDLMYASAHLRALPYDRARDIRAFIHGKCD